MWPMVRPTLHRACSEPAPPSRALLGDTCLLGGSLQPAGVSSGPERGRVLPRWVTFGVLPFSVAMVVSMLASAYSYLQR